MTLAPCSFSASTSGISTGTPGLSTTASVDSSTSVGSSPAMQTALLSAGSFALISSAVSLSLLSYRTTFFPMCSKSFTDPTPLMPEPITR